MPVTQFYVKKLGGPWFDATWVAAGSEDVARKWIFIHRAVDVYSAYFSGLSMNRRLLQLGTAS
jgi:hypothetical protein